MVLPRLSFANFNLLDFNAMNEDKMVENDMTGDRRKPNYFAQYIFPILLVTVLGIFLAFMQGRVSGQSVEKEVTRLQSAILSNSNQISDLTKSVNQLVGYLDAQKAQKAK